jgi:peptidoglycan/LPS O-acetylase OafA/YrhL
MVDLFFVLSGFIFYSIYRKSIENHTLSFKNFAVLRVSRLYPLHWLTLIVILLFQIFRKYNGLESFPIHYSRNPILFLFNIPMLQNGWLITDFSYNGPTWSLSIEIMMYILFFAVFCHTKSNKNYIIYCLLLIYLGIIMTFSGQNIPFFNGQVARGLMGFFLGCITGEVYIYCNNNRKFGNMFTVFCIFAVLFLIIVPIIFGYGILRSWVLVYTFAFFPAFILITLRIGFIGKIFSLKPLIYLGELSYSIYLLHYPMQLIVKTIDEYLGLVIDYSNRIFFIGFSITVIIVSHFIHYYFEKPIQKYIRNKFKT